MPYAKNGTVSTDELEGGIEITDEQYAEALEGMMAGKVVTIDYGFKVDFPPKVVDETPEPTFEQIKAWYKGSVDGQAENSRSKYITLGSGQAMTYMQKASEAKAYLAAAMPVDTDYPLILAEVGITAATLGEVATVVNGAFAQWQQIGAAIETARLGTKAAIEAAVTVEEAQAAAASVVWP
jgi:hypothetical protein